MHESIGAGWLSAQTLVPLLGGLGLLGAFVVIEAHVASPLIPLATLRRRSLVFANLAAGLLWASFLGLIYEATLFTQQVLHYPPLAAGSATIPIAVLSLRHLGKGGTQGHHPDRGGEDSRHRHGHPGRRPSPSHPCTDRRFLPGRHLPRVLDRRHWPRFRRGRHADRGVRWRRDEDEAGLAGGAVETSREMGGALGVALLVSVALGGTANGTEIFHRSVLAAAIFAAASALAAITLLRPTERIASTGVPQSC